MAKRRGNYRPWDENCRVIPMIGGYEAMSAMRESLEAAIAQAKQGKKGHVYIADWRLSPLRDLSEDNPWIIQNFAGSGARPDQRSTLNSSDFPNSCPDETKP